MTPAALGASLLFGVLVGVLSGLIGVGGGVIMVPWLYLLFALEDWSGVAVAPRYEAVVAHATSLLVIVPTALSGLAAYQRSRLVVWRLVVPMGLGSVAAAAVGAAYADALPPQFLKAAFGVLLLVASLRLAVRGRAWPVDAAGGGAPEPGLPVVLACGLAVGLLASLLGVGGGILAIPLLIHVLGVELHRVAATSIGIIVFASAAGALTYGWVGGGVVGLPDWSWGYVFLPAAGALMPGAVLGARWGARLNQHLEADALRLVFAGLFLLMGLRLLGSNLSALLE